MKVSSKPSKQSSVKILLATPSATINQNFSKFQNLKLTNSVWIPVFFFFSVLGLGIIAVYSNLLLLSGNIKKRVYLKTLSKQVDWWSIKAFSKFFQWTYFWHHFEIDLRPNLELDNKCLFAYIFTDFIYVSMHHWFYLHFQHKK